MNEIKTVKHSKFIAAIEQCRLEAAMPSVQQKWYQTYTVPESYCSPSDLDNWSSNTHSYNIGDEVASMVAVNDPILRE